MSLSISDDNFLINKDNKKIVFLNLNSANNYIENENITYDFQFYLYHDQLLKYYKYNSQEKKIDSTMINNTSSISFNRQPQFSVVCFYNNKEIEKLYTLIYAGKKMNEVVDVYIEFIIKNIIPILVYLKQINYNELNVQSIYEILTNKSNLTEEIRSKFDEIIYNILDSLNNLYMKL